MGPANGMLGHGGHGRDDDGGSSGLHAVLPGPERVVPVSEAFSGLLLIAVLVAVMWIAVRPVTGDQKERRRAVGIDGRRRDREASVSWLNHVLVVVALADVLSNAGSGADSVFGAGVVIGIALTRESLQTIVSVLVGGAALVTAVIGLVYGRDCALPLSPGTRTAILLGTTAFLVLVGAIRRWVAPLRSKVSALLASLLCVYGVLQAGVFTAQLQTSGGLADFEWREATIGIGLLAVLAFGTAVSPLFASTALGVAVGLLALATEGSSGCLDDIALLGTAAGYGLSYAVAQAVRRRV